MLPAVVAGANAVPGYQVFHTSELEGLDEKEVKEQRELLAQFAMQQPYVPSSNGSPSAA